MKCSTGIKFLALASMAISISSVQADTTIVIVRHGEKPAEGLGQITCQGLNRSLALAPLLLSRYGNPTAIYAPNPALKKLDKRIPYAYVRPLATIEPLAIRAGLPVNVEWGISDIEPLANKILTAPKGIHVVAWEHHWGESLARHLLTRLGGNPDEVPRWGDSDFDSIFVVSVSETEPRRESFAHEQQGHNGLSENCSEGPQRAHP